MRTHISPFNFNDECSLLLEWLCFRVSRWLVWIAIGAYDESYVPFQLCCRTFRWIRMEWGLWVSSTGQQFPSRILKNISLFLFLESCNTYLWQHSAVDSSFLWSFEEQQKMSHCEERFIDYFRYDHAGSLPKQLLQLFHAKNLKDMMKKAKHVSIDLEALQHEASKYLSEDELQQCLQFATHQTKLPVECAFAI